MKYYGKTMKWTTMIGGLAFWCGLTSCMGDGSGMINYYRVGVVRETPSKCIYTANESGQIFRIASPDFEARTDVKDGDCCAVWFRTNFSEQLGDGVYNAEISRYDSVPVWPIAETLTDTSKLWGAERIVSVDLSNGIYLEGRFFMQAKHTNHQVDQVDLFDLSYDASSDAVTDSTGRRIYEFYLRVAQEGGTGDSSTWTTTNAFVIEPFLSEAKQRESALGLDSIHFRINYPSRFNADTTGVIWSRTNLFSLGF